MFRSNVTLKTIMKAPSALLEVFERTLPSFIDGNIAIEMPSYTCLSSAYELLGRIYVEDVL